MLRVILLTTPVVIISMVSCGDSGSGDSSSPTTSSAGQSGDSSGTSAGESSQAGTSSVSTSGKSSTGGTTSATGGTTSATGGTTSATGGTTSGTGGKSTTNGGSSSIGMAGAGGASSAGAGGAGGAGGAQCADIFGTYTIRTGQGMCGTLNKNAPQSIEGDDVTCAAHFVSVPKTGDPGINGAASVDADGGFMGEKLTIGTTARQPCTGTWNAEVKQLTVKCGGPGDMCTILLEQQ